MSIRQISMAVTLACACVSAALAQTATATPSVLRLEQVLQGARNNLDVQFSNELAAAARADIVSADHAPLPVLTTKASQMDLQHGLGKGSVLNEKRIDKSLGVDWTWERGNKRALRTLSAQRAADAAQADVDDTQVLQLQAGLAGFYDLLAAQERLAEVRAISQSASQLAGTAAQRVRAGDLAAQDAARTEIEAQRAQDWPPLTPPDTGTDLGAVVDARADVRAAQARVDAAQAALDNAQALTRSDITVGASLDHYPGTSTRLLELRLQMPLQTHYAYQGEIARALAGLNQARTQLERVRLNALLELQSLQQSLLGTLAQARSYETEILPRARQVAAGAELAYSKGAIPLVDLLDARRTLRATLIEAVNARADHARAQGLWLLRTQPQRLLATP